jgi:hypothetical protein
VKFRVFGISIILVSAVALGVRTAAQPRAPSPQSADPPLRVSPQELNIYRRAKTLIDWTPREVKHAPSLYNLDPAANQDELPEILERVGKKGVAMISDFRNVACDEHVYSEWTVGRPMATYREMGPHEVVHHFRYIIIPRPPGDPLMFQEYRTSSQGDPIELMNLTDLRLITTNFTGSWAYLNSADQPESRFRYFGKEKIRKQQCYVVGFAQIPDLAQNVSTFEVGKRSAVLLVQGLAWISEQSFHILKIETWLLAPRTDVGLESQTTTVNYFPVRPTGLRNVLWLPKEVTVEVHFHSVYIRNTHRYSEFKLFRVKSAIKP